MKKLLAISASLLVTTGIGAHVNRPIIQTSYTADPAPMVYNDTVFLYTTHDEDDADGFKMFDWLLYTSTDMVNWTDHGSVASLKDFKWNKRDNGAWAEQVVERNGKFYMYCPIHGNGIGVLVSDSPYGPFRDPIGKPLVWQKEHWNDIDPTVLIDDDGQAYMYWGNPDLYCVRLNKDMISTSGEIVKFPRITDYQEGPWAWKRNGKYYMAFASTCCPEGLGYAMSDSPMGPWEYKGHIMDHTPRTRGNHPGIINYKGNNYVFGLTYDVLRLETPDHHERRNVDVCDMEYNPDGTIKESPYFRDAKLTAVGTLNPYRRVEAETMAWGYGLKNGRLSARNLYVGNVDPGEYIEVRNVNFGDKSPAEFVVSAASVKDGGVIELRLDSEKGELIATVPVKNTGSLDRYVLDGASVKNVTGVHDLYLCFKGNGKDLFRLDYWQFKHALTPGVANWVKTDNGVEYVVDGNRVTLSFINPSILRVNKQPVGHYAGSESMSVTAKPGKVDFTAKYKGGKLILSTKALTVTVDKDGAVSFNDGKGRQLLTEAGNARFESRVDNGENTFSVGQSFRLADGEAIYGLGNLENGHLSQRGVTRKLMPGNVEDGIPVFVSVKGYGLFWDNYSPTTFADRANSTSFDSEVGDCVDYYFMAGDGIDGVVAQLRDLTGRVPMFPLWTYGFWQSRERYKTQDETTGVVKRHRELGVPIDGIIQDWQYWGNNYLWNAMEFMNPDFNNPQRMVDDIHSMNAHAIISIWSSFGPHTKPYRDLAEKGHLFNVATWPQSGIAEQWPPRMDYPSGVQVYDAYSSEARDIYWKHLTRLHNFNLDGWWMDSTEPDHFQASDADLDTPTALGSWRRVRNAYPLLTVGGVYDHQRATDDSKRVFILTRSGYTGQQRYGCNVWTGDVTSSWDNLRRQVPALLNFTMTGNPNSNSDIGGFFCGAYNNAGPNSATKNPLFQELFVRWMQFGAFCPMMRSHGADIKREIYYFGNKGEVVYDAIADAIALRYKLLPYIYSTSWDVTANHGSIMRPLAADFVADKNVWNKGNEYMFGDNILVAPILKAHYTPEQIARTDENTGWDRKERFDAKVDSVDFMAPVATEVYLPAGKMWWSFDGSKSYKGGRTIELTSTLKTIPLFVKAGGIIPLGPDVQWATEKPWDNLEIVVYPGADGSFTLYEDEGDNYNYEKGFYSTIEFKWNDRKHTLTVGAREGQFPGMLAKRVFNVRLANGSTVKVDYDGQEKEIKL